MKSRLPRPRSANARGQRARGRTHLARDGRAAPAPGRTAPQNTNGRAPTVPHDQLVEARARTASRPLAMKVADIGDAAAPRAASSASGAGTVDRRIGRPRGCASRRSRRRPWRASPRRRRGVPSAHRRMARCHARRRNPKKRRRVAHAAHRRRRRCRSAADSAAPLLEQLGPAVEAAAGHPAAARRRSAPAPASASQQASRVDAQRVGLADRQPLQRGAPRVAIAEQVERNDVDALARARPRPASARRAPRRRWRVTAAAYGFAPAASARNAAPSQRPRRSSAPPPSRPRASAPAGAAASGT